MSQTSANTPEWILAGHERYLVRWTDTDGQRHDWIAEYNDFTGTGLRRHRAWHAWPDPPEPGEQILLDHRRDRAREEFLLRVIHGWQVPYGFVDGDHTRPVYGRDGLRRERAHILAELTGRAVCAHCHWPMSMQGIGVQHHGPRDLPCPGSGRAPAVEPELEPWGQT